jgi:biotin carboxyl carrier protein
VARTLIVRTAAGRDYRVEADDGRVTVDGLEVVVQSSGNGVVRLGADRSRLAWVAVHGSTRWVFLDGEAHVLDVEPAGQRHRRATSGPAALSSPMPATVVRVEVSPGVRVRRGDTLVILEAMKMELPIRAASDGVVASISCKPGDLVQPGVPLIEIE